MKYNYLIFGIFFAAIMVGCNNRSSIADEQLKELCSDFTEHNCPIEYGKIMSLTKMEFDEGRFIYTIVVNDSFPGTEVYFKDVNIEEIGESMLYEFASRMNNEEKNVWIKNEYSIIYKFVSKQKGKINLIDFTPEQIKTAFEASIPSKRTSARELIRKSILLQKKSLPIKIGMSELLTNASFCGNKVLCEVDIEDNENTILEKRKNIMREGLLNNLSKNFKGAEDLMHYYILGDITIEYIYTGTKSGTTCSIAITPEDLKGLNN